MILIEQSMKTITYFTSQIPNVLRAAPTIFVFAAFISALVLQTLWTTTFFIGIIASCILNGFLKDFIARPLYANFNRLSLPIIGRGPRPLGAKDCSDFIKCSDRIPISFGMPSGHSQIAWFTVVFLISYITYKYKQDRRRHTRIEKIKYYISIIALLIIGIAVSYSRVVFKCHTYQQIIIGGLIGGSVGIGAFYVAKYLENR